MNPEGVWDGVCNHKTWYTAHSRALPVEVASSGTGGSPACEATHAPVCLFEAPHANLQLNSHLLGTPSYLCPLSFSFT